MIGGDKVPKRYVPKYLTNKDVKIVKSELNKSIKKYKKGTYYTRKKVKSFKYKQSYHILNAKKIYGIDKIIPNKLLSIKTGCSLKALKKIENKGMGAYYSSGSRPNQTAKSWGRARLASSITGGKASLVDIDILKNGCNANSLALKLAMRGKIRRTPSIQIGGKNKMKEKIIKFEKSSNTEKKYMAYVKDLETGKVHIIHFGASDYEQYKDRTPLKIYANKNHSNKKRQMNYYSRHSHGIKNRKNAIEYEINHSNGYYNAKILSHIYLW
jgi:hypothetical protein